MTNNTNRLPTNCTECDRKLTSRNRSSSATNTSNVTSDYNDVCVDCYDYWSWENTHSDESHTADNVDPACMVCMKEFPVAPLTTATPKGKVTTMNTNRNWNSHSACTHAKNPKARAACRAAGGPNGVYADRVKAPADNYAVGALITIGKSAVVWTVVGRDGDRMTIESPKGAKKTVTIDTDRHLPAVF